MRISILHEYDASLDDYYIAIKLIVPNSKGFSSAFYSKVKEEDLMLFGIETSVNKVLSMYFEFLKGQN